MSEKEPISRIMTVARILESGSEPGGVPGEVEVVFLESAMFFRLSRKNLAFDRVIAALRNALENGHPVDVRLNSLDSDIIQDVRAVN